RDRASRWHVAVRGIRRRMPLDLGGVRGDSRGLGSEDGVLRRFGRGVTGGNLGAASSLHARRAEDLGAGAGVGTAAVRLRAVSIHAADGLAHWALPTAACAPLHALDQPEGPELTPPPINGVMATTESLPSRPMISTRERHRRPHR